MLGRNHALYGAAGWIGLYPAAVVAEVPGFPSGGTGETEIAAFAVSSFIAAGASVIPDLDHPDAHPARYVGFLSRWFARRLSKAAGGHRMLTHTIAFGLLLGAMTIGVAFIPHPYGAICAAAVSAFCVGLGLALVAPTLGIRIPSSFDFLVGAGAGYWVFVEYELMKWFLPYLAVYGVWMHIACDAVTKGGVPLFLPITKKRFKLGIFRVGGVGEQVATLVGFIGLGLALWRAGLFLTQA